MHLRLDFVMEANNMSTDWSSLIWVHIVLQHRVPKNKRADNKIHDWRETKFMTGGKRVNGKQDLIFHVIDEGVNGVY